MVSGPRSARLLQSLYRKGPWLQSHCVVVPMLVQSCLDAFLVTVVEVKDSLRASPRVLFRCYFSSRPTSRSSLALVPLVVRSAPPMLEDFPSRHTAVAPRLPRIGPIYIYTAETARGELNLRSATFLHYYTSVWCCYVSCHLCVVG